MRNKSMRLIPLLTGLLALGCLASCNNGSGENSQSDSSSSSHSESSSSDSSSSSSSSSESGSGTNEYYDADNFVTPENVVTETKLVTYEGPHAMTSSEDVKIKVADQELFVYETRVNHRREFSWTLSEDYTYVSYFDFEGKVHVEIEITQEDVVVESATISPYVYGITPTVNNNVISFDLSYNDNYVIEYNGDYKTAIQLFANPLEEDPITEEEAAADSSILYVGPGVYKAAAFPMENNQTIYLAGGAYVYGQFLAEGLHDITIRGRGIVSGSVYDRTSSSEYTIPVSMRSVTNLTVEGITFLDPAGWTFHLWKCTNVTLNNVKMITARSNGDGISVQSCTNVNVNGGYARTWDDTLVVKNNDLGSTEGVHFNGVRVWTDLAQSMEAGYETYGETMNDITFENIIVYHNFHKAVISLHNSDQAVITNVSYKNIIVQDASTVGDNQSDGENDFFLDFTIAYNAEWSKSTDERGKIDGVTVENVKVYSIKETVGARMRGESDNSSINNVTIKGLEIAGKQVTSASELGTGLTTNDYVNGLTFETMDKVTGATVTLPYNLQLSDTTVSITNHENIDQDGLIVPDFVQFSGDAPFIGVKASVNATITTSHGTGKKTTSASDDGSGTFLKDGSSGENAYDGDSSSLYETGTWTGEDEEFACITLDLSEVTEIGVVRIVGDSTNKYAYDYSIAVWARRRKTDGTINDKYTRLISAKTYEMTPASGNLIDINLSAQDYGGIQLRLYREDTAASPSHYAISEIEFYPPSLTFNKAIVDSSAHNDVYPVSKLVDGDSTGTSYYESKSLPAYVVIDLADIYYLEKVVMMLPPLLTWSARTQEIQLSVSDSATAYSQTTTEFTVVKERTAYLFDPTTGNRVIVDLDNVACRYLRIDIYTNDAAGNYGAQLSELSAYGTK